MNSINYDTLGYIRRSRNQVLDGESESPSNTWFLEPTQPRDANGISIGSAVFAGLTTVTDMQTDRATDPPTDRPTDYAT